MRVFDNAFQLFTFTMKTDWELVEINPEVLISTNLCSECPIHEGKQAKTMKIMCFSYQNALVLTRYSGLDPEVAGGIDNMIYPRPRVFNIQVTVNF